MRQLDHLSHSSVSSFDCPRLGYHTVLTRTIKDRTLPLALGSAFHDLCATCYMLNTWNEKAMLLAWPEVLRHHLDRNAKDGWTKEPSQNQIEQAQTDGNKMIKRLFNDHKDVLVPVFSDESGPWVEHYIEIMIEGMKIVGYIDMVLPDNSGGVVICDFKTGKHLPDEVTHESVSTYKDQLDLYALAVRFMGLRVSEMKLVFPRLGQNVVYKPSAAGCNRQRDRVARVVKMIRHCEELIKQGKPEEEAAHEAFPFDAHPSRCQWCSMNSQCEGMQIAAEAERRSLEDFRKTLVKR